VESIVTTTRAVLVHESGHAVFSQHITGKWYAELTPYRKNILSTFEELRSERQQLQRIGTGAAVLRFAADVVVDPAQVVQDILAERDATGDIHVPNLALNSTLCLGRVLYNVYLTREVTKLAGLVEDIVGIERYRKMNMIWERYSSIRESDPETMVQCVNEWAELFPSDEGNEGMKSSVVKIIIAAPPSDDKGDGDESGENSGDGPDSDGADGDPSDSSSKADKKPGEGKSGEGHSDAEVLELPGLADDFAEAVEEAAEAVAEFPSDNNHVFSPKDCKPSRVSYDIAVGETQRNKHMMYSMPVTSSDRQLAKKLGQELQNLNISNRGKFVVASAIPPGRLHSRGMMQQAADRSAGRLSVAQPWKRTVRKVDLNPPITVGILTDVSGSQSWATQFSSRAAWIIARAASEVNGKVAAATFGEEVLITLRPGERPETRVEVQANGMTEMFDHAMGAIDTLLNLLNGSGTRILFVATDGEMVENQGTEMRKTAAWVTRLTKAGVVVVWITPDPHDTTYGLPNTPKHAVCVPVNKHRVGRDPKEAIDQIIGVLKKEMTLRNRRAR
jgi:hypothetical protein